MIASSPMVFGLDNLLTMGRHLRHRIGGMKLPLRSDAT
jgi:hypothetical protein